MHVRTFIVVLLMGVAGLAAGCSTPMSPSERPTSAEPSRTPSAERPADPVPDRRFSMTSAAFADGGAIPRRHATQAAGGENSSPPLAWSSTPSGTAAFALECVDLHPAARNWVHWLVVGIPGDVDGLPEGWSGASHGGASELANGFGARGWGGPQPPVGSGTHEYRFVLYALSSTLPELAESTTLAEFRAAVAPATLATASLTGTYAR